MTFWRFRRNTLPEVMRPSLLADLTDMAELLLVRDGRQRVSGAGFRKNAVRGRRSGASPPFRPKTAIREAWNALAFRAHLGGANTQNPTSAIGQKRAESPGLHPDQPQRLTFVC